jgi:hypothetical protein
MLLQLLNRTAAYRSEVAPVFDIELLDIWEVYSGVWP